MDTPGTRLLLECGPGCLTRRWQTVDGKMDEHSRPRCALDHERKSEEKAINPDGCSLGQNLANHVKPISGEDLCYT